MSTLNYTPLDINQFTLKTVPENKRSMDFIFMAMGILTALVVVLLVYMLLQRYTVSG